MTTNQQGQSDFGFSLEDLTGIVRRRFWWFGAPAGLGALLGLIVALSWPAEYEAASIVMIEPQGVPEQLISSTVSSNTEARYGQIKLQILARDNLSSIIDEFELYADEQSTTPREELVERMREATTIEPLPPAIVDPRKPVQIESFRIAFRGGNPKVVAEVANRLTRDFVSANLRQRTSQAEGTSQFIDAELVKSEEERALLFGELMAYREENQGRLPQDLVLNQRRLDRIEQLERGRRSELQAATRQISEIHKQIEQLRKQGTDETHDPVARKRALELALNGNQAQGKTDKHPDILLIRAELAALDVMLEEQFQSDAPLSPAETAMRSEVRHHEVRAAVIRTQLENLDEQVVEIRASLAQTPSRAAQVSQLEAGITGLSSQIHNLQLKKIQADLGQSVELVQKGERFRVVESAVRPTSPVFPNRPLFFVVGFVLGVGVGMFLLVVREMSDTSFHSVHELQSSLELPVLGIIPVIRLPAEIAKARARLRRLALAGVTVLALAAGGGLLFYLFTSFTGGEETAKRERGPVAAQVSRV